jgi:hypothetical protein
VLLYHSYITIIETAYGRKYIEHSVGYQQQRTVSKLGGLCIYLTTLPRENLLCRHFDKGLRIEWVPCNHLGDV